MMYIILTYWIIQNAMKFIMAAKWRRLREKRIYSAEISSKSL